MRTLFFLICLLYSFHTKAQTITGKVVEDKGKGITEPLQGAVVYIANSTNGTYTDSIGHFSLRIEKLPVKIVAGFVGLETDTILVTSGDQKIIFKLGQIKTLKEVEIESRQASIHISSLNPINTQVVTQKELQKAACCNLSESFETNPSVDVNYADAVTGIKQIQMLGLSGVYSPVTTELVPATRGLGAVYGLSFVPGPWIESIQVTKGVGPAPNGFESISGQINTELKKPDNSEKLFLNSYYNSFGRGEINLTGAHKFNDKLSTGILVHANQMKHTPDANNDGFADMPSGNQINVMNRWKYMNNGWIIQVAGRYLEDERNGGNMMAGGHSHVFDSSTYAYNNSIKRSEAFAKAGYVFKNKPYNSIALISSALNHDQRSYFGITGYSGKEKYINSTLLWQSIIGNTNHKYKAGLSYIQDSYDELFKISNFQRTEKIIGAYYEYTYTSNARFDLIAGLRADYHNLFGWIFTPRLHAKYNFTENTIARLSFGRGQRVANIYAENTSVFASSRIVNIISSGATGTAYGLKPEVAWNGGLNFTQQFKLNYREGSVNIDYYYTHFVNNVVTDFDASPQAVYFYNTTARSYSSSFQAEVNYEPVKRLDVRVAYRWFDVKNSYFGKLMQKPYVSAHRAFLNLAYATKSKWKLDYTISWNDRKRLPDTKSNPIEYRLPDYSPSYFLMNAQISKSFLKEERLTFYLGCENITGYRQKDLILAYDRPYSAYFDASMVWGPVIGRMIYAGLRFKL